MRRLNALWIVGAMTLSANAQDTPPQPPKAEAAKQADPWKALAGRRFYDTAAFAGASYAFFEQGGKRRAKHTVFGSGRPVIAEGTVEVELEGAVLLVGSIDPQHKGKGKGKDKGKDKPAPARRFSYEPRADVLREVNRCGSRLVPYSAAGYPVETPLLASHGITQDTELATALTHDDPLVRREALFAYTSRRSGTYRIGFPEVVALLDDKDPELRLYAVWAAGQCQEEAAVPKLLNLLGSEDPNLRREAAGALGWGCLGGAPSIPALSALLERETDSDVRAYAEKALKILKQKH